MKKVAVVILNWNGKELMETFLPSVIEYSPVDWVDIVVADNGSTDDSIRMLKDNFPSVKLIELNKNYGFAEGYNQALKNIDSEYSVLLNSDVEVTKGWLDAPLAAMDTDSSIACVQPKILAQRNKTFFEYAGAAGGYIDKYGYPFCRGRLLHVTEEDKGQYNESIDVLWTTGACLFVRTEIYKEVGGLDPLFFAHQEEVDMCWRLKCRGYRLVCTPESVVYHVGGATLSVESPRKTFLNFRNNLLMVYKNMSDNRLKRVLFVRFFLDYIAAVKFLLTGHWQNAKAVYKARKEFYHLTKKYKAIRADNLSKTKEDNNPELMSKSLLISFYLKGEKTFSDLNFTMKV